MADRTTFKLIQRVDFECVPSAMTIFNSNLLIGVTQDKQHDQILPESGQLIVYSFDGAQLTPEHSIKTNGAVLGLT